MRVSTKGLLALMNHEGIGDNHPRAKLRSSILDCIRSDRRAAHLVAEDYGVCSKTIYRVRHGERI